MCAQEFCRALALVGIVTLSLATESFAKGCMSGACHQQFAQLRYMHGPVAAEMAGAEGCVMCHLPDGPACSAEKSGKFKLKTKDICFACHGKGTGTQHTQSHIEDKCLGCHSPHGSDDSPEMVRAGVKQNQGR